MTGVRFRAAAGGRVERLRFARGYGLVAPVSKVVRVALLWGGSAMLACLFVARAQALEVRWSAPAECTGVEAQADRIAQLLAREGAAGVALSVVGKVTPQGKRYRLWLRIETADHAAQRTMLLADCTAVDQTTAALIAMALDPSLASQARAEDERPPDVLAVPEQVAGALPIGPAQPPPTQTRDELPARIENVERLDPAPSLASRGPWWLRASVFVGAFDASLPGVQVDAGLRLGLGHGAWYGELRAEGMLPRSAPVDYVGTGRVRVRSQALGLSGCGAWGERLRVGPCLRLSVLRSAGRVSQITAPGDEVSVAWLASGLSGLAGLRLYRWLELTVEAGASLPLTARPRFTVEQRGTAEEARMLALHAVLGLGVVWEQGSER